MGFAKHIDCPAGVSTLGSACTAGSTSVTVATSTGAQPGNPTSTNPVRSTMAVAATPPPLPTIYFIDPTQVDVLPDDTSQADIDPTQVDIVE